MAAFTHKSALFALFHKDVAVQLRQLVSREARPEVQPVYILADDQLRVACFHKRHQSHVLPTDGSIITQALVTEWGTQLDLAGRGETRQARNEEDGDLTVAVGTAWSKFADGGGGFPAFSAVHTPFGPRKSATPALVLMPAPVKKTLPFPDSFTALRSSAICRKFSMLASRFRAWPERLT